MDKYKFKIKVLVMTVLLLFVVMSANIVNAFSLNVSSNVQTVKSGDTIEIKIKSDEKFVTSDFRLKYDNKAFEFVEDNYTNMTIKDNSSEGYLMIVYADLSGKGTDTVSIKFKAKKNSNGATFSTSDMNFTNDSGNSYTENQITKNNVTVNIKDESTSQDTNNNTNININNTNINNGNTSTKDNKTTSSTVTENNNTKTTSKSNLPYTGVGKNILIAVIIVISIILAIIFKNKEKYWKGVGMFIITFSIITAYSNNIFAYSKTPTYGTYENLIDGKKILAISLNKNETEKELIANQVSSLVSNVSTFKDKDGKTIDKNSTIGTGSKIVLSDNSEIAVLLYGDVNGDGKINSGDIYPIIQHILNNKKLSGIYAKAANLSNQNDANDKNINSSDIYPLIKYILNDLSSELVTVFANTTNDNIQNNVRVNYSQAGWTSQDVTVNISTDKEMKAISNWSLSSDKKNISRKYGKNTSETVTINYIDGTSDSVVVNVSNIDKTNPTITSNIAINKEKALVGEEISMALSYDANDDNSGINKVVYEVYAGEDKIKENEISGNVVLTFSATKGLNYKINIYAVDRAGNKSETKTFNVEQIDYINTQQGQQEKAALDADYNNNKGQLTSQKQELESKNEKLTQERDEKVKSLTEKRDSDVANVNQKRQEIIESIRDSVKPQIDQVTSQTQEALDDVENDYYGKLKIITNDKEIERAELDQHYNDEIADAKANGESDEAINKIVADYEEHIQMLEEKYQSKIQEIENDYQGQKEKLIETRDEQIAEINASIQDQINETNAEYDANQQEISAQYNTKINDIYDEYQNKQGLTNVKLEEVNNTIRNLDNQYNQNITNLTNTVYINKK